uniref:cinnamyl-alcohol dehydrogenase n=1 Tax=Aegilops tauschii TaxID=37682 RepID=M8B2M9_AEGTA
MEVTPNHTQAVSGWAAMEPSGEVVPFAFKRRENGVDDVTIKVHYCGMCHTDLHFINNDWGITIPMKQHGMLQAGRRLGVVGLGGLGHVAVKFGKAFGLKVTVISTSPAKEREARESLKADDFVLSTDEKQMQAMARSLDYVIDTVSAQHSLGPILELLKVNGKLVLVAAPDKPVELPSFPLIFGKRTVSGSMTGGMKETQEMMDLCGEHGITADIELVSTDGINDALARLARNDVRYRFVVDVAGSGSRL